MVDLGIPSAPLKTLASRRKTRQMMVGKVGIGSDDSTSRKINTLPHEISANTAFLRLETLAQCLERSTTPLCHLWHSTQFIINEGTAVVLEGLLKLLDDDVGLTIFDGSLQSNVGFEWKIGPHHRRYWIIRNASYSGHSRALAEH